MHYDEKHSPTGISLRGVAAAWACCTFVAVGALVVAAIDTRDDRSIAVYARAHIPKASSASANNIRIRDSIGDPADEEIDVYATAEMPASVHYAKL